MHFTWVLLLYWVIFCNAGKQQKFGNSVMKTKSFYGRILMLKTEGTRLLPARAVRAKKGSRSTKGRVAFPWPCRLIKRGIFRIPYSAPCGSLQVSAFHLWQELVPMPTFALTQIGVDTGRDSFPINLTPDTRNVCHEVRLFSIPPVQIPSKNNSGSLTLCSFFCRKNTFLQGEMQWVRGDWGAPSACSGTQEKVSAPGCL